MKLILRELDLDAEKAPPLVQSEFERPMEIGIANSNRFVAQAMH
jgi:hypothetical protein